MLTNLQIQALGDLFLCGDSLEETAQRHQLDLEELRSLYAEFRSYGLGGGSPNLRAIQRQDPIESDPLVIQCKLGLLHLEEIRKTVLRPFIERDRRQAAQAEPAAPSSLSLEDLKSLDLAMKSIDRSIRIQLTLTHRIDTLTSPPASPPFNPSPFNRAAQRSANASRAPQDASSAPQNGQHPLSGAPEGHAIRAATPESPPPPLHPLPNPHPNPHRSPASPQL